MDSKGIGKFIRRYSGRLALKFCSLIVKLVSEGFLYVFADFISGVGYYIAGRQRRIAWNSLNIAFGSQKSRQEIKKIAKDSFRSMARSAVETLFFVEHPSLVKDKVRIDGKVYLDRALSEAKGAIVVSAHFGNFPLMLIRFAQEGYKTNAIIRHLRDLKVDEYLLEKRTALGIATIYSSPRDRCVEASLRVLRANELLFIQMDQNFGTGGIFVDFFGMKAATATGPVVFALRTKAQILPAFIIRNKENNLLKIIIEPPLRIEEETSDEVVHRNIQKITNIIENYIRRYPEEWGWIHRRWKSRPNK